MAVRREGAVRRECDAEGDERVSGGVGEFVLVEEVPGGEGAAVRERERERGVC